MNKPIAIRGQGEFRYVMPSTAELIKLPVADRLALVDELLASISEQEISLDPSQVSAVRARWVELKTQPALGISYDELKSRLG